MKRGNQIITVIALNLQMILCETLIVGGSGSYSTIQSAIDAASSEDTIQVNSGTYIENIQTNKKLFLLGSGSDNTTIYSGGKTVSLLPDTKDFTIKGFRIESTGDAALYIVDNQNTKVIECVIKNSVTGLARENMSAVVVYGADSKDAVEFYNCVFIESVNGIYASGSGPLNIINSIFYKTTGTGIYLYQNCNAIVQNSIFLDNGSTVYISSNSIMTLAYNLFHINDNDSHDGSALGTIAADPKFTDITKSYVLSSDSPAINKGNASSSFNDTDGSRNDIGVYGGYYTWSKGPAMTALSISSASVEQGTSVTITATAKSK
jgi:hypothetical protein